MELTNQQINEAIQERVNYAELARLLETDLNAIALQAIPIHAEEQRQLALSQGKTQTEANEIYDKLSAEYVEFKVFFDTGTFNTTIEAQAPGEGQGFYKTPVLITFINGGFSTERGPQIYSLEFRIEAFGFERNFDLNRKIFEGYSRLNQGVIRSKDFNDAQVTSVCDFPIATTPQPYKGFNRFSIFMSWFLTFVYTGQLSNEVSIKINEEEVKTLTFSINRQRVVESAHLTGTPETITINKSQVVSLALSLVYDGTTASKTLLRNIKNSEINKLNEVFILKVNYPQLNVYNQQGDLETSETDIYKCVLVDGSIAINQGGYIILTATFNINEV
jgi:hypothetical protein